MKPKARSVIITTPRIARSFFLKWCFRSPLAYIPSYITFQGSVELRGTNYSLIQEMALGDEITLTPNSDNLVRDTAVRYGNGDC